MQEQAEKSSTFSKRALWLAVNGEHGERLVEIAREHTRLARELSIAMTLKLRGLPAPDIEESKARPEILRQERDDILQTYA